ncbi:MAG: helix-turn-helix domain-containing protein [Bacteroidales bacterium]
MTGIRFFSWFLLTLLIIICSSMVFGQTIEVPYARSEIRIDGKLQDWEGYYKIVFSDTLTHLHTAPDRTLMAFFDSSYDYDKTWLPLSRNAVETWVCWDMTNLYIAFQVSDRHLFAQIVPEGKIPYIHLNDGIEIYIDSKADSQTIMDINDYQFLIDVTGNHVVFRGDRELLERDTGTVAPKAAGQNIYFEYAVQYEGIPNDTTEDIGYVVEVAIPFAAIGLKPQTGLKMRLDICCNDIDYDLDGVQSYDEKALRYWAFNWIGISDFGYPETWREVQLAGAPGWTDKISGAEMRRWLTVYITALIVTLVVILLLVIRMRKIRKLPTQQEIPAPKIVMMKNQEKDDQPASSTNELILKKAADYITGNSNENIHSEKLANHLGVTIRKLQRITQDELQTTPTNFIYLIKLNLAAEYLKSRKGNISETAYEFGFSDPGYFSKLFKRHFGVSPNEYLEQSNAKRSYR